MLGLVSWVGLLALLAGAVLLAVVLVTQGADRANAWAVAFSSDGRILATASWDYAVILRDLTDSTRSPYRGPPLTGHTHSVSSVAFSPDGHTLATASRDNTAILWDLTGPNYLQGHAAERACSITGRGLNPDEWARYIPGLTYQNTCPR